MQNPAGGYTLARGNGPRASMMSMDDEQREDDQGAQRRDALLRRLLTTPPKSRAELAEELRRAKREKATRKRGKRASAEKREGAA